MKKLIFFTESANLKTFVQNRVTEINEVTGHLKWLHIASKDNPADLLSGGMTLDLLVNNNLWWNGPSYLQNYNDYTRKTNKRRTSQDLVKAIKKVKNGELTAYKAAHEFNIPMTTLHGHVKERKYVWDQWMAYLEDYDFELSYVASTKVWMETDIFHNYFEKVLIPNIGEEQLVLIIYDGNSTHVEEL
ncbi:unnamed protein product [Arctia plantaginis]|uniref:DDE-1 domain-containing protein n=1 Tax=Arctia plantaginis TaxID=874455 RepID=A0A8S1AWG3_ARCPL|nr:unnamed protein product [Arctia plantaginis]